jgi:hypothetical protein
MTALRLLGSAAAALAIGACSTEPSSGHSPLHVVVDRQSVFVLHADTREEATPLADEACHERGAVAVFHGFMHYRAYRVRTNSAWFECIARSSVQASL